MAIIKEINPIKRKQKINKNLLKDFDKKYDRINFITKARRDIKTLKIIKGIKQLNFENKFVTIVNRYNFENSIKIIYFRRKAINAIKASVAT